MTTEQKFITIELDSLKADTYIFKTLDNDTYYIIHEDFGRRPFYYGCLYIGKIDSLKQYDWIIGGGFHSTKTFKFNNKSKFSISNSGFGDTATFTDNLNNQITLYKAELDGTVLSVPYPDETVWIEQLKRDQSNLYQGKSETMSDETLTMESREKECKNIDDHIKMIDRIIDNPTFGKK